MHTSTFCKTVSGAAASLGTMALVLTAISARPVLAQVPAVVATSTSLLATGFSAGPAVIDACGDVYVYEGGGSGIVRIQAGTGVVTTVAKNSQGYTSSGTALFMDSAKKNLYFPDFSNFYTTHFDQVSINNCIPGGINATFANNLGNLGNYYWGTVQDAAGDAAGNVYFITTANVTQAIYKETYSASAGTYADSQVITWKNNMNHIAVDAAGDIFFVDQATQDVYALMITGAAYPSTPTILVPASKFGTITGLSFDPLGNLYITDGKANLIFEVPLEKGALNPVDMFATASVGVPYKVAVDANHNIYLSNYGPGAAELRPGSAIAPPTAFGATSATFPITYVFNAAVTPTGITAGNATSKIGPFSIGTATGACVVGTPLAALASCTVNPTFTPSAIGTQTGVLAFTSASGTLTSSLFGVGQGAAATIDPGTVIPSTTKFTAPSGIAVDSLGNVYVTDATANTLTEFAAGSNGVGTVVSTGALKLSGPKAVAVDSVGNIFIADTGNNRIVEIPVVAGVLSNASAAALSPVLNSPQGVAVDRSGDLFISDTGNNNLLEIPNINGSLNFAAAQSLGAALKSPSAIAFDQVGNLFLAEGGANNDVLEFAYPIGSAAQTKVAAGLTNPTGIATDASNSLFVVDSGSGSIVRYPNVNGILGAKTLVGGTVLNPTGVATDASGNLYVTDTTNSLVAEITRVTAALQFGGVNVGSTGTQTSSINNSGNLPLTFPTPDYAVKASPAPGFIVTKDTCTGATVAPGNACTVTATYSPTAPQLNAEEDLTFSANATNGTPLLQLIGTGAHITPSTLALALTSPAGALSAGQSVTFTATVGTGSNTAVAGGSVKFYVNGIQVGTVLLNNYVAVITLKNGLPSGNAVAVSAIYGGDVINYSSSNAQLVENVTPLADSVSLAVSTQFSNPPSAIDNSAVLAVASMIRTNNTVTATLASTTGLAVGSAVAVSNASDASYNGVFQLTGVTATTVTWPQTGPSTPPPPFTPPSGTISARQVLATGPAITLTASIFPSSAISPGGTVTFYAGSTALGIVSVTPFSGGGYQATLASTALRAGTTTTTENGSFISTYNVSAAYSGDVTYYPATSNIVPVNILAPPFAAPSCAFTDSNGVAPTCLLNTTGASVTITPANPTITVASSGSGQSSGSVALTITSYGGWAGVINFTCTGLPAYTSCAPFPGAPVVNASAPTSTFNFVINTNVPPLVPTASSMIWWVSGIGGVFLLAMRRRINRLGYLGAGRLLWATALLMLMAGSIYGVTGCSSSVNQFITPAGTSNVKVSVHAAQLVPSTTTGAVQTQDANVPPINITLVVQ